jgi:Rrf2 family protein
MKISSKTTYGFRFLLSLAVSDKNEYIKLGDVAKAEDISEKYLENIVAKIKPYGFIEVRRGAQGGYRLAKPADTIRLTELFELLEGELLDYENPTGVKDTSNNKATIAALWSELAEANRVFLQSKTLGDLAEIFKAKNSSQMYFI